MKQNPIACPACGEDEALAGQRTDDAVEITCERCGHRWARDAKPVCPGCGSTDLRPFQRPLVEKARGTAYSVVGASTEYLCPRCDAKEIEARLPSSTPVDREDPWR